MSNKSLLNSTPKSYVVLCVFLLSLLPWQVWGQDAPAHDRLEYQVSVSAQLHPLFAVDANNNPLYDLKKEELELYVDGKRVKIISFNSFQLAMREKSETAAAGNPSPASPPRFPERLNFIVIDSMISNVNTLFISRAIAMEIIRNATPGDAFVIMESNQQEGFQHVIGPVKDKKKLAKALKGIKRTRFKRQMVSSFRHLAGSGSGQGSSSASARIRAMAAQDEAREHEKYQHDIARFSVALERLKYALRSTTLPKTVFLLSPGVMHIGLGRMPVTSLRFLEDAARSVNYGGSLFYLINPIPRFKRKDWGKSLMFMADAAGGKYISGKTVKDIARRVKRNTSAYYELAFAIKARPGQRSRIKVKCSREGVKLTTIANSEQDRPYALMKGLELKLFVLNIVKGGGWSRRLLDSIGKTGVQLLKENETKDNEGNPLFLKDIRVSIPPHMRNKPVHLYQVELDNTTEKVSITSAKKQANQNENFQFKCRDGKSYFIVLIDPLAPSCVYSQVI